MFKTALATLPYNGSEWGLGPSHCGHTSITIYMSKANGTHYKLCCLHWMWRNSTSQKQTDASFYFWHSYATFDNRTNGFGAFTMTHPGSLGLLCLDATKVVLSVDMRPVA